MRIAVVSPHLPTQAFPMRGVRHSEQLRAFGRAGHAVSAVVPLPRAPWRRLPGEEHDGPIVVAHPRYTRLPLAGASGGVGTAIERAFFSRAAARVLDAPDVVLAQSATLPGGLAGRLALPRPIFVVTLHDHEVFELAPRSRLHRLLLVRTLRRADAAVYVSEALRERGIALAGPHRSEVIPIGIDVFEDLARTPPDRFTVCAAARLVARKRLSTLLVAFARLVAGGLDARLVIVGDGPERTSLEAHAVGLRVADKVQFTGALDRRATLEHIARSSVMALPSVLESLGAVYLEAMSLGVVALGTAGEGISAHIEHGVDGVLVPAGDDERLFQELRALASDAARARRIGEAGRERFLRGPFTWRANVEAHLALFAALRGDRNSTARLRRERALP
jgi:glycosyltransferase involved in cell wall biosynthesis